MTDKKSFADLIKNIQELHEAFFAKYSRYIQEGTWQDSNYIDDDKYYLLPVHLRKRRFHKELFRIVVFIFQDFLFF